MKALFFLLALVVFSGCMPIQTAKYDSAIRPPKKDIDVFTDGMTPSKPYKAIAAFSALGNPAEDATSQSEFIKRAKAMGADGIIIKTPRPDNPEIGPFGSSNRASFKATAFIYQ